MAQKLISVIIPTYNEQENIPIIYQRLRVIFASLVHEYEFIFVNDGSRDRSWQLIQELTAVDVHVKGVSFSRNFGYQMALTAGHDYARGDAVITIDADLQDPPELIVKMVQEWEKGFSIVYARRIARNDGFLKDTTAVLYYKLLALVAEVPIPRNVGDFRLIDRSVVVAIQRCREPYRYWRGLVAWVGFKSTFLEFERPERVAGITGYTWKKLIKLACDGLTGFSLFPLQIAAYVGFFVLGTGIFMFIYTVWDVFCRGAYYPLFKWVSVLIYVATGFQFLFLWLIGTCAGRLYTEQKKRPAYIVDQRIGFDVDVKRVCV